MLEVADCSMDCRVLSQTPTASLACGTTRNALPRQQSGDNTPAATALETGHMSMTPVHVSQCDRYGDVVVLTGDPLRLGTLDMSGGTSYKAACCVCGGA